MNQFAESAADVGDGMSRSASVLAQAGASIEESAGKRITRVYRNMHLEHI